MHRTRTVQPSPPLSRHDADQYQDRCKCRWELPRTATRRVQRARRRTRITAGRDASQSNFGGSSAGVSPPPLPLRFARIYSSTRLTSQRRRHQLSTPRHRHPSYPHPPRPHTRRCLPLPPPPRCPYPGPSVSHVRVCRRLPPKHRSPIRAGARSSPRRARGGACAGERRMGRVRAGSYCARCGAGVCWVYGRGRGGGGVWVWVCG
ncbi:hypothetical protein B0H10DRAFT_197058 [Mycena sp. CBHHK59/15]|nr:hypothetical protein B0H10DRAFT_197058 [Mycena sp. CBHHK59/15]